MPSLQRYRQTTAAKSTIPAEPKAEAVSKPLRLIGLDCETTGTDTYHGAYPFLVTMYDESLAEPQLHWPFDVNPYTRAVEIPPESLEEIQDYIDKADVLILQNAKFDYVALDEAYRHVLGKPLRWDWGKVRDTLIAGHILASNRKHDLTSMVMQYLGVDIKPWEDAMEVACKDARTYCRGHYPSWRLAKYGLEETPSVKKSANKDGNKPWRYDTWLPRALAQELLYHDKHPWWTATSDYANADSSSTYKLWSVMESILHQRGYWEIFLSRMPLVGILARMEQLGLTVGRKNLENLEREFEQISTTNEAELIAIAKSYGYDLQLPRGSRNNNLMVFCFDVMKLPQVYKPDAAWKTDKSGIMSRSPTLDSKTAVPFYLATLPVKSNERRFIECLDDKRSRDTALTYLDSYKRYGIGKGSVLVLHPKINPTATDTLRCNCVDPNGQQVGKKNRNNIRKCFGPAAGREWWALDYENIELRIPAYESGEQDLIDLFEKPGPPYWGSEHLLNFSTVYQELWAEALPYILHDKEYIKNKYGDSWYQWCKNGDFALQYNCGDHTGDKAFHRVGACKQLRARFYKKEKLNQYWISFANKHGYVETLPDKTVDARKGYPLLCTRTDNGRILPTVPLSFHVQSTAMQCTNKAMIRCDDYLNYLNRPGMNNIQWIKRYGCFMALQVHDELVFDFPKGGTKNLPVIESIRKLMEKSGEDIGVPLKVSVGYHPNNWGTKEKVT